MKKLYVFTMGCVLSVGPAMNYGPRWMPPVLMGGVIIGILAMMKKSL
jgi:hypothetical protein